MIGLAPSEDTYHRFFKQCLARRTTTAQFERLFQQLHTRFPLSSTALAKVLLSPNLIYGNSDPAHLEYVDWLVSRDLVSAAQVLNELLKTSGLKQFTSPGAHNSFAGIRREPLEQDVFLVLARVVQSKKPRSPESVWTMLQSLSDWMEAVISASEAQMLGDGGDPTINVHVNVRGRVEALGELVVAFGMQPDVTKTLGQSGKKDRKLAFLASLSGYVQCVQVFGLMNLSPRLEMLRQQQQQPSPRASRNLSRNGAAEAIDGMVMGLGESSVPLAWTRGHMYVWLSSLLAGVPHVDENYVVGYLLSRYKDSAAEMVTDFMTAVIDVIANAINKKEAPPTLMLLRSFLVNKVPLLLLRLSQFPTVLSGAITQAFLRADTGSLQDIPTSRLDPYSLSTNDSQDMFDGMNSDLRSDFLFACALHGIIDESEITTMLGELPVSAMSSSGKYTVEMLQDQYNMNHDRADRLLEEIESMEGNAGAVCRTLYEIMKGMCESRATMPLRNFCSFMTRKTSSIDIMLLFVKSSELLEPLCDLLDSWRYEEDQGEYQPVYEEFGCILLFVLTVVRRYSLPISSLYVTHPMPSDSFLASLLTSYDTPISSLSSDRYATLGGWIKELFEQEYISDSLMSSCSPQEFYCLVPTLFSQIIAAYEQGKLDKENVTEAFGLLLQPSLLPSIVAGLQVLGNHLWAHINNPGTVLSLLTPLVLTSDSLSPETAEAHRTAISISSRHICTILTSVAHQVHEQGNNANQQQISEYRNMANKLLARLRPLQTFSRSCIPTKEDLDSLVHGQSTISGALTSAFTLLATWPPTAPLPPPLFSPKLLVAARTILGPRKIVHLLLQCCVDLLSQNHTQAAAASLPGVIPAPPPPMPPGDAEDILAAILLCYLPAATSSTSLSIHSSGGGGGGGAGAGAGAGGSNTGDLQSSSSLSASSSASSSSLLDAARLVLAELLESASTGPDAGATTAANGATAPATTSAKPKSENNPQQSANNNAGAGSTSGTQSSSSSPPPSKLDILRTVLSRIDAHLASIDELGRRHAASVDHLGNATDEAAAAAAAAAVGMEMDMVGVGVEGGMDLVDAAGLPGEHDGVGVGVDDGVGGMSGLGGFGDGDMDIMMMDQGELMAGYEGMQFG